MSMMVLNSLQKAGMLVQVFLGVLMFVGTVAASNTTASASNSTVSASNTTVSASNTTVSASNTTVSVQALLPACLFY